MIGLYILIFVIGLAIGAIGGMFIARRQIQSYLEKNPPLNEGVIRTMMTQMGQKPSEAKVQQVVRQINRQQQEAKKKK